MSGSREYVINYGSLPFGEHEFEFHINDAFFQRFENSLVQKGDIDVLVVVDKKELMMLLDFTMEGHVIVECDRCLEDLELPIESYEELIVKFGEKEETESEEVIVVSTKEYSTATRRNSTNRFTLGWFERNKFELVLHRRNDKLQ